MNFNIYGEKFNLVSEVGLPNDGDWVIAVFGSHESGYSWQPAGYQADNKCFYASMGYGGLVLDQKDCVAWILWDDIHIINNDNSTHTN